ncbi:MAG: hypothetical protein CM1200mP1_12810 [Candidatus Neomarinimicrobiota bacterium]|nr:MAG: hypothetical protein CM1200mP1_12810 [Candidatus Neomarinimicrobiota bacterium]
MYPLKSKFSPSAFAMIFPPFYLQPVESVSFISISHIFGIDDSILFQIQIQIFSLVGLESPFMSFKYE